MRILSSLLTYLILSITAWGDTLIIDDPKDGWLNLRSGPGTSYRVLQRMDNGLRVEELERSGTWSNIALPNGREGWAYRKYMKTAASNASQPFRAEPGEWYYQDGEAAWDLNRNGQLTASVFVGRDLETGGYYYGLYRVSSDPMIHFMGASVAYSNGKVTELAAGNCYGRNCMATYDNGSGQVRIPISRQDKDSMLEHIKSAKDITFRYQTKASYAENAFKNMKMGLKGSRRAIEALQNDKRLAQSPSSEQTAPKSITVPSTSTDTSTGTTSSAPQAPTSGFGKSYVVNETRNGDTFCDAKELGSYPPQLDVPEMEWKKTQLLNDAYSVKYVNPVSMDFIGRGMTLWRQFPGNSNDTALYANGAAVARGTMISNGKVRHDTRWKGSWEQKPGVGLMIRLKSVEKLSWGHEYYQCSHGILTDSRENGNRPTIDKNGKSIMRNSVWRGCSFWIHCERWTDQYPEREVIRNSGYLVEWSRSQIPASEFRWDEDY
ncbi:MAG: SH3 domain-containing protein [Tateyamaria sp.]|uniref:SH3 domain-containing protein n=1 Tax=Alphaproteobacteria TaxID=28211 RepID=UPI00326503CE